MKSKLGMVATMLLAGILTTYSGYLSAQADIAQAWKGSTNSRTWVVFDFTNTPPDKFHLEIGDAFRIQGMGSHVQIVPLGKLRTRWNRPENSYIPLNRAGKGKQKLCGRFDLDNHPGKSPQQHFILIEADPSDENKISIIINDDANFGCDKATHGGTAHAQN